MQLFAREPPPYLNAPDFLRITSMADLVFARSLENATAKNERFPANAIHQNFIEEMQKEFACALSGE
jgi:hypothetical protein